MQDIANIRIHCSGIDYIFQQFHHWKKELFLDLDLCVPYDLKSCIILKVRVIIQSLLLMWVILLLVYVYCHDSCQLIFGMGYSTI